MTILEKEIWITLNSQAISHYKSLGYTIPTHKSTDGIYRAKKGTRILVRIEDLLANSKVTKVCDFCGKNIKTTISRILKGRRKWPDGKDRCKHCADIEKLNFMQSEYIRSNSIAITHPNFALLFWDNDDTYNYTHQSNKKVDFKCPNCGTKIINKRIQDVYKYGLSCVKCSDGYSYPEKFVFNLLSQLGIEFETQKSFEWSHEKDTIFIYHR